MKPVRRTATITIDFNELSDYPISHDRIALFNSGLVTLQTYERDRGFFAATAPEHLRVDLGWGAEWMPWTREVVSTVDGQATYDFAETDAIARALTEVDVRPYWAYSYVPQAARPDDSDWRTTTPDDSVWVDTVAAYVASAADRGVTIGYHEVYNEPDLRDEKTGAAVFYAGDLDDYLELYRRTSRAIREADPSARIGGPALASVNANAYWLTAFLEVVAEEHLPLDFLSFHHYGTHGLVPALETVLATLDRFPQFAEVEVHLNEYNSFVVDYPEGGAQDTPYMAAAFAADLEKLLSYPSLTRVSWAQFLDSGNDNFSGMITIDGRPKPIFHVYEFFQRMPVQRRRLTVEGPAGIGGLASSDGTRSAALIWNRSTTDVTLTVTTSSAETATVAMIDASADARSSGLEPTRTINLARGAVALLLYGPVDSAPAGARVVRRSRSSFTDRVSSAWADVDERTATIRFGTAHDPHTTLRAGMDVSAALHGGVHSAVTLADGTGCDGAVTIEDSTNGTTRTIWATLTGAPPHAFATVTVDMPEGAADE